MENSHSTKVFFAFVVALLLMIGFFAMTLTMTSNRNLPNTEKEQLDKALRGIILSSDGFTLAASRQLYRAEIDTRSPNADKLALLLKLFQIYSGIDNAKLNEIKARLKAAKSPNFVLLRDIDSKEASYLKELGKKLYVQGFFKPFENEAGKAQTRGLDILLHRQERLYLGRDSFSPILGYTQDENGVSYGVKGIERYYEKRLGDTRDEKIHGVKDIAGVIVLSLDAVTQTKNNGCNLHLNLSLKLQKSIESMLDRWNLDLKAEEIIIGIMQSKTGKMLALASSRRFDPARRTQRDVDEGYLNISAVEYAYEPGSVIKPFVFATALRFDKLKLNEKINTFGGEYKLGRFIVKDDHRFKTMKPADILAHSSNVGMIQIAKRLEDAQIIGGLEAFGFGKPTKIDLTREQSGVLPRRKLAEIQKSVLSYGYGLTSTFIQLLAAYNVFNNEGFFVSPKIADFYTQEFSEERHFLHKEAPQKVLDSKINETMKQLLSLAIDKGTGKKAAKQGLIIGGKTGTARIAERQGYSGKRYNASFFGFANDSNASYTIGVLVRNPTKPYSYYAAQSAVPIFADTIEVLVQDGFLKPLLESENNASLSSANNSVGANKKP